MTAEGEEGRAAARERFIPVHKAELLDALIEHGALASEAERAQFRRMCRATRRHLSHTRERRTRPKSSWSTGSRAGCAMLSEWTSHSRSLTRSPSLSGSISSIVPSGASRCPRHKTRSRVCAGRGQACSRPNCPRRLWPRGRESCSYPVNSRTSNPTCRSTTYINPRSSSATSLLCGAGRSATGCGMK